MSPDPTCLLVVDDDAFRERIARAFRARGYEVHTAADAAQALELARTESPDWALVDLRIGADHGLEVLRDLKALDPTVEVVMLTGYGSIATAIDAIRLGARHYVAKPAGVDDVIAAFQRDTSDPLAPTGDYKAPTLARAEWEHINRVLADTGHNISEAARRLGLHRRSLQRKLSKYPPKT